MADKRVEALIKAFERQLRCRHTKFGQFADKSDVSNFGFNFYEIILFLHRVEFSLEHFYQLLHYVREVLVNDSRKTGVERDQLGLSTRHCEEHFA